MEVTPKFCGFDLAWQPSCKVQTDGGRCDKHQNLKCRGLGCGAEAVRECDHTGIQFVCGAPLCATCKHGPPPKKGTNWFLLGGAHLTNGAALDAWSQYYKEQEAGYK